MAEEPNPPDVIEPLPEANGAVTETASTLAHKLTHWIETQQWVSQSFTHPLAILTLLAGLLLAAWLLFAIFRPLILRWMKYAVTRTEFQWDNQLLGHGVFRWLTHLLPGLLIYLLAPGLFESAPPLVLALRMASSVYLLITGYLVVDSLLNAVQNILSKTRVAEHLNLTSISQVLKLVVALITFLLIVAVFLQKSPYVILSGLGILASILLLVFKDVILGFVAGIQLACNQMLSVGDWLEMPSHSADGDVELIGLTTVKVRNWDKTVTTIPTHALISEPFKNWRGMSESGGRRIKRSFLIDTSTIRLCSEEMLGRFREIEHISEYLRKKEEEVAAYNKTLDQDRITNRVNGRRLTNVGTFRAYIEAYLRHHPEINQEMTLLVRQLAPQGRGLPIEIYCFSANKNWSAYESIQADIFDHLLAVAPEFDLRIFQDPTGYDVQNSLVAPAGVKE